MKNIITVLLITFSLSLFSQERREMINGEEFIIHTVKKGETLYKISNQYNKSKKEIRNANSGFFMFIKTGQELKIPIANSEKKFHIVKSGETLYGISKKYGVKIDDIVKLNPVKSSTLKVGDRLVLRKINAAIIPEAKPVNTSVQNYTVKSGETLYGISRKYGISVVELKKLNPGIKDNISVDDVIKVPTKVIEEFPKKIVDYKQIEYKVSNGETWYGISKKYKTNVAELKKANPSITNLQEGNVIKINVPGVSSKEMKVNLGDPIKVNPVIMEKLETVNPLKEELTELIKKEEYSISLFLPLELDKNSKNATYSTKPKIINPLTEMSIHFYQGIMLGFDSATVSGNSFSLNVYDTKKDSSMVTKYLKENAVKKSDLIIGPFYENTFTKVAQFSKQNKIQALCPVAQRNKLLFNNKYVVELQSSYPTQMERIASYLGANRNKENVICLTSKDKKDIYLADLFSKIYATAISGKASNYRSKATLYKMTSYSSLKGFENKLVKGKKNVIVLPFRTKGMASAFFTQLNNIMSKSRMKGYEIEIFGLDNLLDYDNINVEMKMKYNLHVTTSSFIDYKSENIKNFIKKYRTKYGTEPTKYAFIGFDVAFYHGIAMSNYGKNYSAHYGKVKVPLLQNNFNLKRKDDSSGFENQSIFILTFKDYELVKVD